MGNEVQIPGSTIEGNAEIWRRLWALQEQIIAIQKDQAANQKLVAEQLGQIKDILSQAKGGWKMLLIVGTVAGAILTAVIEYARK